MSAVITGGDAHPPDAQTAREGALAIRLATIERVRDDARARLQVAMGTVERLRSENARLREDYKRVAADATNAKGALSAAMRRLAAWECDEHPVV